MAKISLKWISLPARTKSCMPIITIHDLTPGRHTLTIQVTGSEKVVLDAFDVQAPIVSHLQETDPTRRLQRHLHAGCQWLLERRRRGHGARPAGGRREICRRGGREDHAHVPRNVDHLARRSRPGRRHRRRAGGGGAATQVDTFGPTQKFQEVMFLQAGLADATHTLTIQVTGQNNATSTGTKIVVDAFDVTKPGRRFQEHDFLPNSQILATIYTGSWTPSNDNRV